MNTLNCLTQSFKANNYLYYSRKRQPQCYTTVCRYNTPVLKRNNSESRFKFYFVHNLSKIIKPQINTDKILEMDIPNCHIIENKGVRGESLSSKKNRKFLKPLKRNGIKTIIDLRDKFKSESYPDLCKNAGLKYFNIPIDSSTIKDENIIQNLPLLVNLMNEGNYYISCAQGLHRTDIAVALSYVFNPKSKTPPEMVGHIRESGFKSDDIIRRINSVSRKISEQDLKKIGWRNKDAFLDELIVRKQKLVEYNCSLQP